jgi:phosphonate transport system substrate-binding protein
MVSTGVDQATMTGSAYDWNKIRLFASQMNRDLAMRRLHCSWKLLWSLLFIFLAYADTVGAETRQLVVGVVPQFPALQIYKEWTPFLEKVSRASGVHLVLKAYKSIPEFEADIFKGGPDFALMNPYHEVMAKRSAGYLPLVRNSEPLIGYLLVRRDSDVRNVRDLAEKPVAFPSPNAFVAALYMRALLIEREGVPIQPAYVKTHSNVIRQVILGEKAAGGVASNAFQLEPDAVREQVRILFETPGVASHPLAVHPRISKKTREAVRAAILKMGEDDAALTMLRAVQLAKPVVADYERDYLPLERLRLEKYVEVERD